MSCNCGCRFSRSSKRALASSRVRKRNLSLLALTIFHVPPLVDSGFPFFLLVPSLFVGADRFYSSDLPFLLNRSPTMFRTGSKSGFSCARLSPSQLCATAVRASARRPAPLFPDREFPCSHRSSSRARNRPCAGSRNDLQCRLTWLQGRRAVTVRCSFSGRKTLPHRPLHGSAGVFSWRSLRHSRSGFR